MLKLVFYLYKIFLHIARKLPELREPPFLTPGPCSEEKVHLLFGHLSDTLTATFLCQSLHALAWRNIVCKNRGNFSLNEILTKEERVAVYDTNWDHDHLFITSVFYSVQHVQQTEEKLLWGWGWGTLLCYFLCPEVPNPEVLPRKGIRHWVKWNTPFLAGNADVTLRFNGLNKPSFQNTHDISSIPWAHQEIENGGFNSKWTSDRRGAVYSGNLKDDIGTF